MPTGRSSVLREKLKESTEKNEDGKVVLKLEVEDVALEVIDIFLNFLYSGKLKDIREEDDDDKPTWVKMLPQLVDLAYRVSLKLLLELVFAITEYSILSVKPCICTFSSR